MKRFFAMLGILVGLMSAGLWLATDMWIFALFAFGFMAVSAGSLLPEQVRGKWTVSEKGNPTAEIDGHRVTVFRKEDGWHYCVAEITEDEEDDFPEFGGPFPTGKDAQRAGVLALAT